MFEVKTYAVSAKKHGTDEQITGYIHWDGLSDLTPVYVDPDCKMFSGSYLSALDSLEYRKPFSHERCEMCGEKMGVSAEPGEFVEPNDGHSVFGHAQCGITMGYEIA